MAMVLLLHSQTRLGSFERSWMFEMSGSAVLNLKTGSIVICSGEMRV